jgi:hypothetical protein
MTTNVQAHEESVRAKAQSARGNLSNFADRAVQILQELAEYAENDRVRLSAVNSILDRAGVTAPTEIKVTATQEEHALVRAEAEEVLVRMRKNVEQQAISSPKPSLEALVVIEGNEEEAPSKPMDASA